LENVATDINTNTREIAGSVCRSDHYSHY